MDVWKYPQPVYSEADVSGGSYLCCMTNEQKGDIITIVAELRFIRR